MDDEDSNFIIQQKNKDKIAIGFITERGEIISINYYPVDKHVKEIISEFTENITEENIIKYFKVTKNINKYNLVFYVNNSKKLYLNDILSMGIEELAETVPLITMDYNNSSSTCALTNKDYLKILVKYEKKFKNLVDNFEEYFVNHTHLIGKPQLNKKNYFIYNRYLNKIILIKYPEEDLIYSQINNFSIFDTYCNAKNNLFIYEGVPYEEKDSNKKEMKYSKFYSINLVNNKITLISKKFPERILHSMIYIPESYIFIIGGKKANEVIIYNMKDNIDNEYEDYPYLLPKELYEPSLISINNQYIYALENSTSSFNIFRINLLTISPFESIKIKESKNIVITQKFFGVVKNKNSILFIGGQMLNIDSNGSKYCFEFHYDTNKLVKSSREFIPYNLIEKTLLPIGNDIYVQFFEYKKDNKNELKMIQFDARLQEMERSEKSSDNNNTNEPNDDTSEFSEIKNISMCLDLFRSFRNS